MFVCAADNREVEQVCPLLGTESRYTVRHYKEHLVTSNVTQSFTDPTTFNSCYFKKMRVKNKKKEETGYFEHQRPDK